VGGADDAGAGDVGEVGVVVVGDEERGGRAGLEAQLAAPGEVLDCQEGSVGDEDEIPRAVAEEDVLGGVDDAGEDRLGAGAGVLGQVGVVDEDGGGAAELPFVVDGRVDGGFDVGAVKVDGASARGEEVGADGEAEGVEDQGAARGDLVDVEARVELEGGEVDVEEEVAFGARGVVGELARQGGGLDAGGREGHEAAEVVGVAALVGGELDGLGEGVVEGEDGFPFVDEGGHGDVARDGVFGIQPVEDHHAGEVEVGAIVLVEHGAGDVRGVHAAVGRPGHVDGVPLEGEGVDKVLPEAEELAGDVGLVARGRGTLGEAGADGLVNPDDVGQMVPGPFVGDGLERAGHPKHGAVLLEELAGGGAAGAARQPDENLLLFLRDGVGGWEEPEEELVGRVVVVDGEQPGVGLADVKVNFGNARAIDGEF